MQAGEAASLADVCPSADIRARCSGRIARKHGHLGVPLVGSQSRLKGTGSRLPRKQTSPHKFPVFPPHPTLGHRPVLPGDVNAWVMVPQSLVELGEGISGPRNLGSTSCSIDLLREVSYLHVSLVHSALVSSGHPRPMAALPRWLVESCGSGGAARALRGAPGLRASGSRRARGRLGERRAAELSSTRVLSARGHGDAGPGSPRAQCRSPRLSNSPVLCPTLLAAHEAAASPPASVRTPARASRRRSCRAQGARRPSGRVAAESRWPGARALAEPGAGGRLQRARSRTVLRLLSLVAQRRRSRS